MTETPCCQNQELVNDACLQMTSCTNQAAFTNISALSCVPDSNGNHGYQNPDIDMYPTSNYEHAGLGRRMEDRDQNVEANCVVNSGSIVPETNHDTGLETSTKVEEFNDTDGLSSDYNKADTADQPGDAPDETRLTNSRFPASAIRDSIENESGIETDTMSASGTFDRSFSEEGTGLIEMLKQKPGYVLDRTCRFCGVVRTSPADLERHLRKHTGEQPFVCSDCGRAFKAKRSLQYHQYMHHGIEVRDSNISTKFAAARHRKLELDRLRAAHSRWLFEVARQKARGYRDYRGDRGESGSADMADSEDTGIDSQGKPNLSTDSDNLSIAEATLSSLISSACEVTMVEPDAMGDPHLLSVAGLSADVLRGMGVLQHNSENVSALLDKTCRYCGKVCPKPSDLRRHLMVHTGERPHRCHVCGKAFRAKPSMQYHQKAAHGLALELSHGLEKRYLQLKRSPRGRGQLFSGHLHSDNSGGTLSLDVDLHSRKAVPFPSPEYRSTNLRHETSSSLSISDVDAAHARRDGTSPSESLDTPTKAARSATHSIQHSNSASSGGSLLSDEVQLGEGSELPSVSGITRLKVPSHEDVLSSTKSRLSAFPILNYTDKNYIITEQAPFVKNRIRVENETVVVTRLDGINVNSGKPVSLYKCHICSRMFSVLSKLQCHLSIHFDRQITTYQCSICSETFKFKNQLFHHGRHVHNIRSPLEIQRCLERNYPHSDTDEAVHGSTESFQHSSMSSSLATDYSRNLSLELDENGNSYETGYENVNNNDGEYTDDIEHELQDIMQNCDGIESTMQPSYCKECGKVFIDYNSLHLHVMRFHSAGTQQGTFVRKARKRAILASLRQTAKVQSCDEEALMGDVVMAAAVAAAAVGHDEEMDEGQEKDHAAESDRISVPQITIQAHTDDIPTSQMNGVSSDCHSDDFQANGDDDEDITVVIPVDPPAEPVNEGCEDEVDSEAIWRSGALRSESPSDSSKHGTDEPTADVIGTAPRRRLMSFKREGFSSSKSRRKSVTPVKLETQASVSASNDNNNSLDYTDCAEDGINSGQTSTENDQSDEQTNNIENNEGVKKEQEPASISDGLSAKSGGILQSILEESSNQMNHYDHEPGQVTTLCSPFAGRGVNGGMSMLQLPQASQLAAEAFAAQAFSPSSLALGANISHAVFLPAGSLLSTPAAMVSPIIPISIQVPRSSTSATGVSPIGIAAQLPTSSAVALPDNTTATALSSLMAAHNLLTATSDYLLGYPSSRLKWEGTSAGGSISTGMSLAATSGLSPGSSGGSSDGQGGLHDHLFSHSLDSLNGISADGRKVTSLSRTHSRLHVVHSPINRDQFSRPITLSDGRSIYKCSICSKEFPTMSDINRHMDFHEDIRPYKCQFCDYYARTNSQLKVHMMRHQGIREYCCKLCNYKGVTQSDLNRHMKSQIHMLKSRNECQNCGEGFVTPKNLERHHMDCLGLMRLRGKTKCLSDMRAIVSAPEMSSSDPNQP